jgi:ABC-type transport system involved in multi-copper enzyme maturation permease subunit
MIGRVYAIALNTFREAIRNRVLYGIIFVVILLNLSAIILGQASLHEEARVARDVGLSGVSLFGSITAIILGVSLLYGEIQRRTIHTIVSKPIHRYEFVLGKYLGMALTLTLLVLIFTLAMAGLLWTQGVPFSTAVTKAVMLSYMEVLVVAGIALFFSSFSSPFLSGVFAFALFYLGRVTPALRSAAESAKMEWMGDLCSVGLRIVPDLHLFSVSGSNVQGKYVSVHSEFVTWGYVGTAAAYAALVLGVLLLLAVLIFSRRDFA